MPEVKQVVQTIMAGEVDSTLARQRGFELCLDLGLVALENGEAGIAIPLCREVLPRFLNYGMQVAVPRPEFLWQKPGGALDVDAVLREFQAFWCGRARGGQEPWKRH